MDTRIILGEDTARNMYDILSCLAKPSLFHYVRHFREFSQGDVFVPEEFNIFGNQVFLLSVGDCDEEDLHLQQFRWNYSDVVFDNRCLKHVCIKKGIKHTEGEV